MRHRQLLLGTCVLLLAMAACTAPEASAPTTPVPATPVLGPTPVVVRYACDDGKAFEARVLPAPAERATLVIEGRTVELQQERAASGIRYSDGTLIYSSRGAEAFIEQGGQITYRNCRAQ